MIRILLGLSYGHLLDIPFHNYSKRVMVVLLDYFSE